MSQSGVYNGSGGGGGGGSILGLTANNAVTVTADPISHNIFVVGGPGVTTVGNNVTHTLQINASVTGLTWNSINSSRTLVANNGYFCSGGSTLSLLLPATSSFGDQIVIILDGSSGFIITQSAGQQVRLAKSTTTLGVGGSIASTFPGDTITLICKVSNTTWTAQSSIGNLTIV